MTEAISIADALTPSILKAALSNSLLKEILTDTMVFRGQAICLEDCVTPGYYIVDANSYSEFPPNINLWNYGILEVMKRNADIIHRFTHVDGLILLTRVRRNNVWRPWFRLTMEQVST